jgi:hypothetical protein
MHKRLVFLVSSAKDYIKSEFNIRIESERTSVSGKLVKNLDFIGRLREIYMYPGKIILRIFL